MHIIYRNVAAFTLKMSGGCFPSSPSFITGASYCSKHCKRERQLFVNKVLIHTVYYKGSISGIYSVFISLIHSYCGFYKIMNDRIIDHTNLFSYCCYAIACTSHILFRVTMVADLLFLVRGYRYLLCFIAANTTQYVCHHE